MRFAALITAVMMAVAVPQAMADDDRPRIEVTGQGEASLAPDMAELNLTVTREAETARAALDASNAAMAEVLAAMREEGIEERDLQTSGFHIQPRIVYPENGQRGEAPRIAGYTVSNSLAVRVRDLGKLGAILDRSVTLGVNEGGGIVFSHSDPSQAIEEARIKAVHDATRRAQTLAEAAGGSLGELVSLVEHAQNGAPRPFLRMEAAARAPDAVPVAAGENSYRVTVGAVFRFRKERQGD
jgi:uncharacterized protein YggE